MIAKVADLQAQLSQADPHMLALRSAAEFIQNSSGKSVLRIPYYGHWHQVILPEFQVRLESTAEECGLNRTSMFLYYFLTADGTPTAGKWIAFRELPGGMFYHQAYQGYSGDRLAKAIDNKTGVFERAAKSLGGIKLDLGDASFAFHALPRVQVAAVYYAGDEDFPATASVLFDAAASHYLPTDALAGVGSSLVDQITGIGLKED